MIRRLGFAFAFVLSVVLFSASSPAVAETASEHVSRFQSGLIDVMKEAKALGVKGRYDRLRPLVVETFNLPLMAGLAAGPHWKSSSEEQRKRLVEAFSRMSVATLATLFDGYSGESFTVQTERDGPQHVTFVDTVLNVPSRETPVQISYVARKSDGVWRLIDVIVDGGISELKVRISEYRQTLKDSGIEGLISLLDGKADELLK